MTNFQHITDIGEKPAIASLEDNIKGFLDWGFLNIGGFINVHRPTTDINGGGSHILKPVSDPTTIANSIWATPKKDWICESGVTHQDNSPIPISGIYINNAFIPGPTGNATHPYRINYPLGQIIFQSGKSPTSNIQLDYSYRYVQVYKANEATWWKEVQNIAYNPNGVHANGDLNIMASHSVQLPAIVVETIARTHQAPYQLGTTENIITQDLLLHIFTQNPMQRNTLANTLILQKDKELYLYNINKVIEDGVYLLNHRGEKNASGLNYGQIINTPQYQSNVFYVENAVISEFNQVTSSLSNAIVRWSITIFP